jgi:ribosomal protein L12E/L44/L45/RPP1/RPP2
MCQKPQDRAREKRRLTKRLANWRVKQALAAAPAAAAVAAAPKKAAAPAKADVKSKK